MKCKEEGETSKNKRLMNTLRQLEDSVTINLKGNLGTLYSKELLEWTRGNIVEK